MFYSCQSYQDLIHWHTRDSNYSEVGLCSHEIARFWKRLCPVTLGKPGKGLHYDPKVNAESQHATGRPEELSRWSYTRQRHMRSKVAPANEIPGEECEPKLSHLRCARSKQALSLREARHTQWSEWDSGCWDLTLAHWHHCHDIPPCIPHPYTVLIMSPWLLKRLQGYYLGWAEILEKDTLVMLLLQPLYWSIHLLYVYPQLPSKGESVL